ncbi:Heavy metal-associated isoprenylated plant protein 6-like protein [Drosera capensis]
MGEKVAAENKEVKAAPNNNGGGGGGATTVVMKVDLHCEGCAKKVRRSIKHLDGVESATADLASNKITVVGDVDPTQVKEKVEEKIKKKVELVSVSPKKNGVDGGEKKSEDKSEKKPHEKKNEEKKPKEPPVSTVVFSTRVHCDGCAQKIKRIVSKYEGVQDVSVDLQKDVIIVKGTMNMKELLPYLNTKLKRTVEIAPPPKKDGGAPAGDKKPHEGGGNKKEGGGNKKEGDGDKKEGGGEKKDKEGGGEKKDKEGGGEKKGKEGGEEKKGDAKPAGDGGKPAGDDAPKVEVNKMEYYGTPYGPMAYTYDPSSSYSNGYVVEYSHAPYPPQPQPFPPSYPGQPIHPYGSPYMHYQHAPDMFSDENPNAACSIM